MENSTGSSKRVRLAISHGLTTASDTTHVSRKRRSWRVNGNAFSINATGSTISGSNRPSSARASIASAMATPTHAAVDGRGERMNRYVSRIASATASVASVSDITRPSFIQRLGYTAAIPAASNPARLPATARPSNPITSTTAAPKTVIVRRTGRRWSPPALSCSATHAVGVSASAVSGGCSAVCEPSRGSVKPSPRASVLAWAT